MTIELPGAIAAYFAADATKDADRVTMCFTPDAEVKDEGRTHHGHETIRAWKVGTSNAYTYTVEPFSIETQGDKTVVTSRLEGDFPGSPTNLRYFFRLDGDRIAHLEIIP